MVSQIKLGRIFGIEVGLHYSWFLTALLIVFSFPQQFKSANSAWGSVFVLALSVVTRLLFFVSLLLRELSHSLYTKSHAELQV